MKRLQHLTNQLRKFTFRRFQKAQNIKQTSPQIFISKSFSKDEDSFMFI